MKSLNFSHTQFQTDLKSSIILGVAVIAAAVSISAAFQRAGNANNSIMELAQNPVPQVVIEGKRMTVEEKLAYDLAPEDIARVEIVGHRLGPDEKLTMMAEQDMAARPVAPHRKA